MRAAEKYRGSLEAKMKELVKEHLAKKEKEGESKRTNEKFRRRKRKEEKKSIVFTKAQVKEEILDEDDNENTMERSHNSRARAGKGKRKTGRGEVSSDKVNEEDEEDAKFVAYYKGTMVE